MPSDRVAELCRNIQEVHDALPPETARNVLVIDIDGTHVKAYPIGHRKPKKIDSGPAVTPKKMIQVKPFFV
jgi:hypothetical protein